jgi:hypothetical protein
MKPFVCLLLLCYAAVAAGQKNRITVKAGSNIMEVIPATEIFYYPEFKDGAVYLRNGSIAAARINYNRLVDEMHFISPKGDTMALSNEKEIKHLVIGADTFYYENGYLRLLASGPLVKLAVSHIWVISDTRQLGAYNSTNNSVSITSFRSLNQGGRLYDLVVNADLILTKVETFYFGDESHHFVEATRKNLLLLQPKQRKRIESYLKENKTSFRKQADLEKLTLSLSAL